MDKENAADSRVLFLFAFLCLRQIEFLMLIQSSRIRDYIAHVQSLAAAHPTKSPKLLEWADWALKVAADLDPTAARLSTADQESEAEPPD